MEKALIPINYPKLIAKYSVKIVIIEGFPRKIKNPNKLL
tara:strand:+ start:126 stop:242 length:117 start_codon:yes stop_codon:yes gene_type:complete